MKNRRSGTFVSGLLALAVSATVDSAEIAGLVPIVRSEAVTVSFRLEDGFDEEIIHAIEAGLDVSFRYNAELKEVRGIWLDKKLAARRIRTTVAYDNLTKRYSLTREIDGEIDATEVVADVEAMRRFMTTFDSLPLFDVSPMAPNEEYYVRVKAVLRERNLLLLIPWDVGAEWREAHFTYLP